MILGRKVSDLFTINLKFEYASKQLFSGVGDSIPSLWSLTISVIWISSREF